MPTLELETWRCDIDGHLARLRMNRPQALNAANWAWVQDLVTATAYLAQSSETHVVIVSGEGRAFCSGLDTKELAKGNTPTRVIGWHSPAPTRSRARCWSPERCARVRRRRTPSMPAAT